MEWTKYIHVASSMTRKENQTALFIGRWQPLHEGHKALFAQALNQGKSIVIAIRDIEPDEKNPFTSGQVKYQINQEFILKNNYLKFRFFRILLWR